MKCLKDNIMSQSKPRSTLSGGMPVELCMNQFMETVDLIELKHWCKLHSELFNRLIKKTGISADTIKRWAQSFHNVMFFKNKLRIVNQGS